MIRPRRLGRTALLIWAAWELSQLIAGAFLVGAPLKAMGLSPADVATSLAYLGRLALTPFS